MEAIKILAIGHLCRYVVFIFYIIGLISLALESYIIGIPFIILTLAGFFGLLVIDILFIYKALKKEK